MSPKTSSTTWRTPWTPRPYAAWTRPVFTGWRTFSTTGMC